MANRRAEKLRRLLADRGRRALISCEGVAEEVIVGKLVREGRLIVPESQLIRDVYDRPYTHLRSARDIATHFLDVDYGTSPIVFLRVLDNPNEGFRLSRAYCGSIVRFDLVTRPEIEMLVIIAEDALNEWERYRRRSHGSRTPKASTFCKDELGMKDIKKRAFLEAYWRDGNRLVNALGQYDQIRKDTHLCLMDLVER